MAGEAVVCAAALDHRIQVVVTQVTLISGEALAPHYALILPSIYTSRNEAKAGNQPELLKIFTTDPEGAAELSTIKPSQAQPPAWLSLILTSSSRIGLA